MNCINRSRKFRFFDYIYSSTLYKYSLTKMFFIFSLNGVYWLFHPNKIALKQHAITLCVCVCVHSNVSIAMIAFLVGVTIVVSTILHVVISTLDCIISLVSLASSPASATETATIAVLEHHLLFPYQLPQPSRIHSVPGHAFHQDSRREPSSIAALCARATASS